MAKDIFTRRGERAAHPDSVAVIGLGRFGGSLALELEAQGTEVLGIDNNEDIVQSYNGRLAHVVRADSTKEEVLRQLSVHEFDRAVVGIGSDLEASILTTSRLLTFKHPQIWAKAISEPHAEILEQLGVQHVIRPEHDMGRRVAHLVRGSILDYVEFEDDFVMVRTQPPADARDRPLGVLGLRDKYGITIVAVKRPGGTWQHTTAQTVLYDDDQIIVQGTKNLAERFSSRP
ncbi:MULTISPECIES: potassium channel family protein [Pseudarthrobacter]|uniref:Potassium transporter n=2 Tax=Pseudarthrobacter TaxID=1742993 RepID=A0ABQ1Y0Y0_9MICC|nr:MULTISPECIES: TrkA family potassium uptake protein [Pseudarthrobacter]MBD1538874.1 TrkA family potassium uptake protein [Arthrobacter sp. S13_S34]MBD1593384.1 TrkA family potassium uptake protein [Arthrobacter sp. S1_S22]GGH08950.1 potassium transporter [Pseudarthrobacter polychromogenes]GGI68964.1 potassium transporter [Pseudarthrobacter scleromae]